MVFRCPKCSAGLTVTDDDGKRGRKAICPKCREIFEITPPTQSANTPPQPAIRIPPVASMPRSPKQAVPPVAKPDTADQPFDDPFARFEQTVAEATRSPAATAHWEIDRKDYEDTSVDLPELEDLLKRCWLHKNDRIRLVGSNDWLDIRDYPPLAPALAVRLRTIQSQLRTMARKESHTCENHTRKLARFICFECARAFCDDCSNPSEIGDEKVVLCLDCDVRMKMI